MEVKKHIMEALEGGYATVIFDCWDDVNSSPVVNVLLKMEPALHVGGKVFFLKSVYSGSSKVGAKEYVKIIEDVMEEYGGMDRICAITSDNASSCLNARDEITRKYGGIVGVNDQSHVADLLIEDIGKLSWVQFYIEKVAGVATALHAHRKLKERYRDLLDKYNVHIKSQGIFEEQDLMQSAEVQSSERRVGEYNADRDPKKVFIGYDECPIRTAVMLAQMSNTRFASAEGVLDAFLRSVYVLRALVSENDFYTSLYKPKNARAKQKMKETFVNPIESEEFEQATREIHSILKLLRRYLRLFDSNDARISEVYPMTNELQHMLEALPDTNFVTRDRKAELLKVFFRRKDGPICQKIRVRLLEDIHYTAFMLDPNRAPKHPQHLLTHFEAHARKYASAEGVGDIENFVDTLKYVYACQLNSWDAERTGEELSTTLKLYDGNPLIWWQFAVKTNKQLTEFALRTLSCSPTSCAVEHSFSAQKRMHPKERSRLSQAKVQKLMFCHWNVKLKRNLDSFDKDAFWASVKGISRMFGDENVVAGAPIDKAGSMENDDADVPSNGETVSSKETANILKRTSA